MDELETAVLLCFNPPADKTLKENALLYCRRVQSSPDAWRVALQRLTKGTSRPEVAFWFCQVLRDTFSNSSRYPTSFSAQDVITIRDGFIAYFMKLVNHDLTQSPTSMPSFLLNKIAQVIVSIIAADYPAAWPAAFNGLILPLANESQPNSDPSVAWFFRILRALDEDVTNIRATQKSDESRSLSMRVKDAMREDCIPQIINICANFLTSPSFASQAFDILTRYVEWVDIGLVVIEDILEPIYAAVTCTSRNNSRPAASATLRAIVMKRMDPDAKANLLKALRMEALLQAVPTAFLVSDVIEYSDPELPLQTGQTETAALVNTTAMVALDILKESAKQKKGIVTQESTQSIAASVAQLALPVALQFLDVSAEEGTSSQTLQCVATYVNVFARYSDENSAALTAAQVPAISAILQTIEERALLPRDYDPLCEQSDQHRALSELRKVLINTIFRSVVRAFPSMCIEFVRTLFSKAAESKDIARTDLALEMVLVLGATAGDNEGVLELRRAVLASPPPCMDFTIDVPEASMTKLQIAQKHQLELVSNTYFSLVARSYRLFLTQNDPTLLSTVLPVFFDTRGLGQRSSDAVRSHAAYSFLKLVRPLRSVMSSTHLEAVLNAAQGHMFPLQSDVTSQAAKDQMMIFEIAGYLISTGYKKEESLRYLSAIVGPIVKGLGEADTQKALSYISAAGFLSKGFGGDSKPLLILLNDANASHAQENGGSSPTGSDEANGKEVKAQKVTPVTREMQMVWIACLEAVLKRSMTSMQREKNTDMFELRKKLLFFLHRMVDTIGLAVLPYLEKVLPELLSSSSSPPELRDAVILASQAVTKFGDAFGPVASRVYVPIVEKVLQISCCIDSKTLMAISEEGREAVEMQRAYIYFLHALVGSDLIVILLYPNHQQFIQPVMASIIANAVGDSLDVRVAASVMKMALDTLGKMTEQWASGLIERKSRESPPGFTQFALEKIAPASIAAGLRGTIFRSSDYSSSEKMSVISEIVSVQRRCAFHLGRPFMEVFMNETGGHVTDRAKAYLSALYTPDVPISTLTKPLIEILQILRNR